MFGQNKMKDFETPKTPLDTDFYVRNFVVQNCIKIRRDMEKLEPLTDDFIHFHLSQILSSRKVLEVLSSVGVRMIIITQTSDKVTITNPL
jgi:hypothetical protein